MEDNTASLSIPDPSLDERPTVVHFIFSSLGVVKSYITMYSADAPELMRFKVVSGDFT